MCDTSYHAALDDLLVEEGLNLPFRFIKQHRYQDECCRIEAKDGPPQYKPYGTDRHAPWALTLGDDQLRYLVSIRRQKLLQWDAVRTQAES